MSASLQPQVRFSRMNHSYIPSIAGRTRLAAKNCGVFSRGQAPTEEGELLRRQGFALQPGVDAAESAMLVLPQRADLKLPVRVVFGSDRADLSFCGLQ